MFAVEACCSTVSAGSELTEEVASVEVVAMAKKKKEKKEKKKKSTNLAPPQSNAHRKKISRSAAGSGTPSL